MFDAQHSGWLIDIAQFSDCHSVDYFTAWAANCKLFLPLVCFFARDG